MTGDSTLGGYLDVHGSPPTFSGVDGNAYSVEIYVDEAPHTDGRFGAAILFVRWSAERRRPEGHLETPYLAYGDTQEEAGAYLGRLTMQELKSQLDQLIEDRKELPDW